MKINHSNKLLFYFPFLILFLISLNIFSAPLRYEDKIRIREAIDIRDKFGESIWPCISSEPFILLLVTDDTEYMINHPEPTDDFIKLGYDTILKADVYSRKRVYDSNLLATFPAVNGLNTIVVGTPENTNKNSSEWVMALLHEHFHQYTFNSSGYNTDLESLNLRGDDWTGMWMLNYPFPYEDEKIQELYNEYAASLYSAALLNGAASPRTYANIVKNELNKLRSMLDEKSYNYLSFQQWQEGIARYTEYKFLELLDNYESYPGVASLTDYESYTSLKHRALDNLEKYLNEPGLGRRKRVMFYYTGMAEGLLLDKTEPDWRDKYLTQKFFLDKYYSF